MSTRFALAVGLAAGLTLTIPARADDLADGVAAIPGAVEDVRIGGTWEANGNSGVYRIVVTRSGGNEITARLFVQWVAYQADGGTVVSHSIEIKEFAELGVDIDDYTSESDSDGLAVYIRTINPAGSDDLSYELFVFSPDDYRFGSASN